ncbi:MAG: Zn-dependent hydrolase [Candidatus Thorarchaeota archaeon]|nr:MAG: Zn-dependent hydrolase [Candidatus Thorarchaeota archaeon]
MKVQKIGTRGRLVTFTEPYVTNMYVIESDQRLFICDTSLGPRYMEELLKILRSPSSGKKPVVIFNSHHHYDHVWGNMSFPSSIILAHEECRRKLTETGENDLVEFKSHSQGDVKLTLPNMVFEEKVSFPDDEILFFYSPGHTVDSSSCYDEIDKVLFVGDNVESPLPYLNEPDLDSYEASLEAYLGVEWDTMIAGHDPPITDDSLLLSNLLYIRGFRGHEVDSSVIVGRDISRHLTNLTTIAEKLKSMGESRDALGYFNEATRILESMGQSREVAEQLTRLKMIVSELSLETA